jgi:hypothetical protein
MRRLGAVWSIVVLTLVGLAVAVYVVGQGDSGREVTVRRSPFASIGELKRMPPSLRSASYKTLGRHSGLDLRFRAARQAHPTQRLSFWIVEGDSVVCIFQEAATAVSCAPDADAVRHGVILETGKPDDMPTHFLMLGIAPCWAKVVHLQVGAKSMTAQVRNSIFILRARQPIKLVRFSHKVRRSGDDTDCHQVS